jgi:catechol 2,3-dioxygenase-like lactoylglutathione lyase family enzyme
MVPAAMEVLAALPLTPNGKVDRRALARRSLPIPAGAAGGTLDSVPQTPTEELLAGLWAEVLGFPEDRRIGRQDNFFHLGGHSLLATQVVSRACQAFGAELTVLELFEHPTLAAFAAAVDDAGRAERLPPLVSGPAEDEPPLSFTQERFWFLDQMTAGTNTYSVPFAVLLEGRLHVAALERFFAELSTRHEVLRATFPNRRGQPIQRISPPAGFTLPVVDLEGLARAGREAELARLVSRAAQRPFDLARGPLMRAALVRLRERRHALLVGFHHIVADGWSVRVLIEEVQAAYGAFAEGRSSPLPPLPIQYRDYARWQRSWMGGEALAAEIAHWRRQLGERPPVLSLPRYPAAGGRPIPAVERFRLPAEAAAGLRGFSQRRDATLFVTLVAAWGAVLGRYSGQARVVVGTVAANRNRVETEGLIGCFVNTLALAIDLSGDPTFDELVARVRRASFDAYAHQDLPFERLVEAYNPDRSSIQPLFQAFFTFEDAATQWPPLRLPDLEMRTLELASSGQLEAKFDLAMGVGDTPAGLRAGLGYNTAMYPAELVNGLVDDYRKTLFRLAEGSGARLSELPGPSTGERRALAERFPGAPAVGEPEKAAAPGKSERQQLAEKRSRLEERLAKLPPELRARFARRLGESGVDPGPRPREG